MLLVELDRSLHPDSAGLAALGQSKAPVAKTSAHHTLLPTCTPRTLQPAHTAVFITTHNTRSCRSCSSTVRW
jgi:hypothetical protein